MDILYFIIEDVFQQWCMVVVKGPPSRIFVYIYEYKNEFMYNSAFLFIFFLFSSSGTGRAAFGKQKVKVFFFHIMFRILFLFATAVSFNALAPNPRQRPLPGLFRRKCWNSIVCTRQDKAVGVVGGQRVERQKLKKGMILCIIYRV